MSHHIWAPNNSLQLLFFAKRREPSLTVTVYNLVLLSLLGPLMKQEKHKCLPALSRAGETEGAQAAMS
jgi:hypothetical protein